MVFSKYCRLLLKRKPPRDMSSQTTTSSAMPGRRTQAWKVTRVRACFRRFSRSFVAMPAAFAGADSFAVPGERCCVSGCDPARSRGAGGVVSDGAHAFSVDRDDCSCEVLGL